jgi:alpha-glucosidase
VIPREGAGVTEGECIEDDGESEAWRNGDYGSWKVTAQGDAGTLVLSVEWHGRMRRPAGSVDIHLPASETRSVTAKNGRLTDEKRTGGWVRFTCHLSA